MAFRRIALFYGATLAVTHGLSLAYLSQGGAWGRPGSYIVANLLMLCPGVVAMAVVRLTSPAADLRALLAIRFRPNAWFLVSWLLPPAVVLAARHVPLFFEGGYVDAIHPVASALGMVAFLVCLAPVLQVVRARSGSVVACGLLHGTFGSSRLIAVAFVRGAGPLANFAIPLVLMGLGVAFSSLRVGRRGPGGDAGAARR